jgi:hypothetical protein
MTGVMKQDKGIVKTIFNAFIHFLLLTRNIKNKIYGIYINTES